MKNSIRFGFIGTLLLASLFSFSVSFGATENDPKEITIGFTPGGDADSVKRGAVEIAKALQEELGISVNVLVSKNYSSLIESMKAKKVDFAFFSSMSFVYAEKAAQAKVLLKKVWKEPYYYSVILTDNPQMKSLKDLKGKRIAFVDEKSTSGYLYPQLALKKAGLKKEDFKETIFAGTHAESISLLDAKKVDAIAVFSDDSKGKQSAWVKYSKNSKSSKSIKVLWASDPIPNDPFCVRQDFYDKYPKLTHTLMFSLIDIYEKLKAKDEVRDVIAAQGFMPATTRQYDSVREIVKELNLKLE